MPSTAQSVQVDGATLSVLFDAREALSPPGRMGNDVLTPTVAIEMAVQTTPAQQDAQTVSSDIAAADVVSGSAIAELYVPRSDKRGGRQQLNLRVVSERQRVQQGQTVQLAVIVKGTLYAQDQFTITVALPKGAELAAGNLSGLVMGSGELVFANITPPEAHEGAPASEDNDEIALPFALVLGADMRSSLRLRAQVSGTELNVLKTPE